jgi:hypothetical protein
MSDVDQYLPDRVPYFVKLKAALAPGGRFVVVNRRGFRKALLAAAAEAGFLVVRMTDELPVDYMVVLALP